MSQRRQQKRAKQVRRTNQRAAQRAKRPPTPGEIAARLLRDFAVPLASRDPLDAELVAAATMATGWRQVLGTPATDEANELPHPAMPVISLLRNLDPSSGQELLDTALALAHALAVADRTDPQVVAAGGVLVERLREAGATDPVWAGATGQYELVTAHDVRDVWMDQHQLVLEFRDSEERSHALVATIDRTWDMQFAELEVIDDPAAFLDEVRSAVEASDDAHLLRIEELSPARAGGLLQAAIEGTFDEGGEILLDSQDGEDVDLLQLAISRHELLEPAIEADPEDANATPFDSDLDDTSREVLDEQLREFDGPAGDLLRGWVFEMAYPRALFGPIQVQEFLLHYVPSRVTGEDERRAIVEPALETTRAWARHCAAKLDLPDEVLTDVLDAITDVVERFEQVMHAPPESPLGSGQSAGDLDELVSEITEQMRTSGVDLGDPVAVRTWMEQNVPD